MILINVSSDFGFSPENSVPSNVGISDVELTTGSRVMSIGLEFDSSRFTTQSIFPFASVLGMQEYVFYDEPMYLFWKNLLRMYRNVTF